MISDSLLHPAHYEVYPVQPIQLTRHLGFYLGNAVKCVLRAPYKDGVEDCDKALRYLEWVAQERSADISFSAYTSFICYCENLMAFFVTTPGDALWNDIADCTFDFMQHLDAYLQQPRTSAVEALSNDVRELRRILSLRDTTGQIYEGMSGLPQKEPDNGHN